MILGVLWGLDIFGQGLTLDFGKVWPWLLIFSPHAVPHFCILAILNILKRLISIPLKYVTSFRPPTLSTVHLAHQFTPPGSGLYLSNLFFLGIS